MLIALDISCITPHRTGIGHATHELATRMVQDERHDFLLYFNSLRQPFPDCAAFRRPNVRVVRHRIPGPAMLYAWKYLSYPRMESLLGCVPDVFFSFSTYVPPSARIKRASMLYDLEFMTATPHTLDPLGGRYLKWVVENRLRELCGVVCISAQTLTEYQKLGYNVPACVVPLGVDERFRVADDLAVCAVQEKYALNAPFVFYVGNRHPRKNLGLLYEAMLDLRRVNHEVQLVMAGPGWGECACEAAQVLRGQGGIRELGYVAPEELPALYSAAQVYCSTSSSEGFGLPVIEALACGCPVACTDTFACVTALDSGDCVETFSEGATAVAVSGAILRAWDMKPNANLRAMGLRGQFSWDVASRKLLSAIERFSLLLLLWVCLLMFEHPAVSAQGLPTAVANVLQVGRDSSAKAVYLPYAVGLSVRCMQGPNGKFSHQDVWNRYAYDFDMAEKTPVHVVLDGRVVVIEQHYKEGGASARLKDKANRIIVDHGNNVFTKYLHLYPQSTRVSVGDFVRAGDCIALSGNTGYSSAPHLHFQVQNMIGYSRPSKFIVGDNEHEIPKAGVFVKADVKPTGSGREQFRCSTLPKDLFAASGVSLSANNVTLLSFSQASSIEIEGRVTGKYFNAQRVAMLFADATDSKSFKTVVVNVDSKRRFVFSLDASDLKGIRAHGAVALFGIAPLDSKGKFSCKETLKIALQ